MSAVQHARLAARPAGRQPRPPSASTAAAAWNRERGVADCRAPLSRTPHPPPPCRHSSSCTGTLQTAAGEEAHLSLVFTLDHKMDFSDTTLNRKEKTNKPHFHVSHLADNGRRGDNEEVFILAMMWSVTFSQPKHFFWGHQLRPGRSKQKKAKNSNT